MARKDISNQLDRENRNAHNDNFKELYDIHDFLKGDLGTIHIDGSPKEVFETLAELENKYPEGANGIYLVLESDTDASHIYFWNGANWEDAGVYQNEGLSAVMTVDGEPWEVI